MATVDIINKALYPNSTKDTINFSVYPHDFIANNALKECKTLISKIYAIRNKKLKEFIKKKRIAFDCSSEIKDTFLIRHFLLETVEEINSDLIKNNKSCRVAFGHNMLMYFFTQEDIMQKMDFIMMMIVLMRIKLLNA